MDNLDSRYVPSKNPMDQRNITGHEGKDSYTTIDKTIGPQRNATGFEGKTQSQFGPGLLPRAEAVPKNVVRAPGVTKSGGMGVGLNFVPDEGKVIKRRMRQRIQYKHSEGVKFG